MGGQGEGPPAHGALERKEALGNRTAKEGARASNSHNSNPQATTASLNPSLPDVTMNGRFFVLRVIHWNNYQHTLEMFLRVKD